MSWKLTSIALLSAMTALGVACVSEGPTTLDLTQPGSSGDSSNPSGGPTGGPSATTGPVAGAKDMFINQVYPSLMSEPAGKSCGSCHAGTLGPQYLVQNAEGSYTYLDNNTKYIALPDNSILYLHGMTEHTGPAFTKAQADLVKAWLLMEADERGLAGGGGGAGPGGNGTLAEGVVKFGGCMSLTDWTDNNLQNIQDTQVDGGERCRDCHSQGQNNTWLGPDTELTFEMNTKFPFIMRLISGTVDEEGNFADLVESKRFIQKGQEACVQEPCHPKFQLADDLKTGLHQFFILTKTKYDAGTCADPGTGGAGGGP